MSMTVREAMETLDWPFGNLPPRERVRKISDAVTPMLREIWTNPEQRDSAVWMMIREPSGLVYMGKGNGERKEIDQDDAAYRMSLGCQCVAEADYLAWRRGNGWDC